MKHTNFDKIFSNEFCKAGELYCTICGRVDGNIQFKKGYICDSCLKYVKAL